MTSFKDLKQQCRKERLAFRDGMALEQRHQKSILMAHYVDQIPGLKPGIVVSGFLPIRSEADLRPLMNKLHEKGVRLCLPVVQDRETIIFRAFEPDMVLIDTGFGTRGPGPQARVLEPDIILAPLAAFDQEGHRLGYGAGHYDRAVDRMHQKGLNPRMIGVAFDGQEVAHVPTEPHDVKLDAILTESGMRFFA